jgi:uncharacterized phage infection (PIP) family protein YhgE
VTWEDSLDEAATVLSDVSPVTKIALDKANDTIKRLQEANTKQKGEKQKSDRKIVTLQKSLTDLETEAISHRSNFAKLESTLSALQQRMDLQQTPPKDNAASKKQQQQQQQPEAEAKQLPQQQQEQLEQQEQQLQQQQQQQQQQQLLFQHKMQHQNKFKSLQPPDCPGNFQFGQYSFMNNGLSLAPSVPLNFQVMQLKRQRLEDDEYRLQLKRSLEKAQMKLAFIKDQGFSCM